MRTPKTFPILTLCLLAAPILFLACRNTQPVVQDLKPGYKVLFSIPIGDNGIHYEGNSQEDVEDVGPSTLSIDQSGNFLVSDSVGSRVLQYSQTGVQLRSIPLKDISTITDVITDGEDLVVLDAASISPSLVKVKLTGEEVSRSTLKADLYKEGLSGILFDENRNLAAELQGGTETTDLEGRSPKRTDRQGRGVLITTDSEKQGAVKVTLDQQHFATISPREGLQLGAVAVLNTMPNGEFFVLTEELDDKDVVSVDQTIKHYGPDGNLINSSRVPIRERFTFVSKGVTVAPDGQTYALITRPDRVDVVRLEFTTTLTDLVSNQPSTTAAPSPPACLRTRDQIIETAKSYINNQTTLTATRINEDGTCQHRQRPKYLDHGPGKYESVPYDWGGFDSVSEYNQAMTTGGPLLRAGDRKEDFEPRDAVATCSHGVDCSGFVSRCWVWRQKRVPQPYPISLYQLLEVT